MSMDSEDYGALAGLLGSGAGATLAETAYDRLGEIGREGRDQFSGYIKDPLTKRYTGGLADELSDRLTFQPYTVTTATGSNFGMSQQPDTVAADGTVIPGGMNYLSTLSPDELAFQNAQLGRAESFLVTHLKALATLCLRTVLLFRAVKAKSSTE